jgi:arginine-tRNA-protein transferase
VYLGYWVPESRKMTYKARFKPSETLAGGIWRVLPEHTDSPAMAEPPVKVSVSG